MKHRVIKFLLTVVTCLWRCRRHVPQGINLQKVNYFRHGWGGRGGEGKQV